MQHERRGYYNSTRPKCRKQKLRKQIFWRYVPPVNNSDEVEGGSGLGCGACGGGSAGTE